MYTHANKTQDNKTKLVANQVANNNRGATSTAQFVNNRPLAIQMRKIQGMVNNSPQGKQTAQLVPDNYSSQQQPIQRQENKTGLPENLKSGVENLSGYSMDNVKVHYNSDKPAQLQAHAYAQGTNIHVAPGQEKHLPHEAWHVVQQKQGRVKPTMQMKGKVNINEDPGLEKEADVMGAKALRLESRGARTLNTHKWNNVVPQKINERDSSDIADQEIGINSIQRIANTDVITPPANGGVTHPTLQRGDVNQVAIKELQSKLRLAPLKSFQKPSVSGEFDLKTQSAVKKFQRARGLGETGIVDNATWTQLDTLGAVNIGYIEKNWSQHISGQNYVTNSKFSWSIDDRQILVEVGINFTNPEGLDNKVFSQKKAEGIRGILLRWNNFKAVKDGSGEKRNIQFKVTQGGGHNVRIRQGSGRSNANNWYILDPVYRDVAAHEFGHLIGLADEYQMEEADYQTKHPGGTLPQASAAPTQTTTFIAGVIERCLAGDLTARPLSDLESWLSNNYGVKMGQNNGMAVRSQYETLYGGNLVHKLNAKYGAAHTWNIVRLFTYTDENSLMGTKMHEAGRPKLVDPQPRHLNEFVMYVQRYLGGNWTAQRK